MNEQQSKQAADNLVKGIKKDFTIVGSHRVHSWYAWALVGIVFGMALGVMYVANRSGDFIKSEAAGLKITVRGPETLTGFVYKAGQRKQSFIADAGGMAIAGGQTITTGTSLDYSFSGSNVRNIYNFDENDITAILVSTDGSTAWLGARDGQKIGINTLRTYTSTHPTIPEIKDTITMPPDIQGNEKGKIVFKGVYINSKGQKKSGTINGTLYAGIDIGGTYAMRGDTRTRTIDTNGTIIIPRGMPLYTDPKSPISITVDSTGKKFADQTLLIPHNAWSGTYTLYFRDKDTKGANDGKVEIVNKEFVANKHPEIDGPKDKMIEKTAVAGQTLTFTVTAKDPENDAVTFTSNNLPEGATLDKTTGVFTWTPAATTLSSKVATTIYATDEWGATSGRTIMIKISPMPAAPAEFIKLYTTSITPDGNTRNRVRKQADFPVTFGMGNTNEEGVITISKITLSFKGSALKDRQLFNVSLVDNDIIEGTEPCDPAKSPAAATCVVTFTNNYTLKPKSYKNVRLYIDANKFSFNPDSGIKSTVQIDALVEYKYQSSVPGTTPKSFTASEYIGYFEYQR